MSEFSAEFDRTLTAYQEARHRANAASSLAKSAAVDVADEVILFAMATGSTLKVYTRAKSLADKAKQEAREAWTACENAHRALAGQGIEEPSAVAPAEGQEINSNGK